MQFRKSLKNKSKCYRRLGQEWQTSDDKNAFIPCHISSMGKDNRKFFVTITDEVKRKRCEQHKFITNLSLIHKGLKGLIE